MHSSAGLGDINTILLDGDGVLWKDGVPTPGLNSFFNFLDLKQINWALLTNNNTQTVQHYEIFLRSLGIAAEEGIVFTSSSVTAKYALERFGEGASLFVIGMEGLKSTLREMGFKVFFGATPPPNEVAAVIVGEDFDINFEKIKNALRLILKGIPFIATNTDRFYPTPDGINPGTGLVVGALQTMTKIEPTVIGKPQKAMFEMAISRLNASLDRTLMVGDTLETDILGASRMGIKTAVVLCGVTTIEEIEMSEIKPDYTFKNLSHLHGAIAGNSS